MNLKNYIAILALIVLLPFLANAQSKRKFPFLKAPMPHYITSTDYKVEKLVSDTNDYQYRVTYYFPTVNMHVTVFSSLANNGTGVMMKEGSKLMGNKSFKFVSLLEDLPKTIEAADIDGDNSYDYIIRLKNNIGSSFGKQVHTTLYMFRKPNLFSYQGHAVVSFFAWKEYDINKDGKYEIPSMDLVGIQQESMFALNMFQFKNNTFENVGGEKEKYPMFYKYKEGDTVLPTKVRKVKLDTRKYYVSKLPMITYHEQ